MQTNLILRRTQMGQVFLATSIALVLPFMWYYVFQSITMVVILTLGGMVMLLALGLFTDHFRAHFPGRKVKKGDVLTNHTRFIEEDLSNPADLWIWPVEPIVEPVQKERVPSRNEMSWLREQPRRPNRTVSSELNADWLLLMILVSMIAILTLLWLKVSG